MSVLLEALKKAAENKKQSDASTDSLEVHQRDEISAPLETQPDVKDDTVSVEEKKPSVEPITSPLPGIRLSTEPEEPVIEKPPSIDDLDIPDNVVVEPDVQAEISTITSEDEIKVPLDMETPELSNVTEIQSGGSSQGSLKSEETSQKQKDESDESFDWSLNKLPGYEHVDSIHQQQSSPEAFPKKEDFSNQILSTNKRFFRSGPSGTIRQFIFGGSSNIAIYLLFSIFTITVIGFFSIYYFQQQSEQLDQSMLKYNLVRTVLPADVNTVPVSVPARADTNDSKQTEAGINQLDTLLEAVPLQTMENTNALNSTPESSSQVTVVKSEPEVKLQQFEKTRTVKQSSGSLAQSSNLTITAINQESNMQLAYSALYENDLNQAQSLFDQILNAEPENVSALNGLASVYAQADNESEAVKTYQQVLSISPNNLHAFEALVSLLGNSISGIEWKREIIKVLEMHPDSSVLNYAVGNIFAAETDWKTAQEYYFSASALDQTNADYLLNLAVSLDHLGQYKLAEKKYTLALVHASSQQVSFDEKHIKQRLITIRQFIGKSGQ
ncbi:MAG: tetratricopeptide repeat protein [Pseudomonadota bacterium]|nr:tetratricopeptide repeat protein [Pseudomonadota bacterium]